MKIKQTNINDNNTNKESGDSYSMRKIIDFIDQYDKEFKKLHPEGKQYKLLDLNQIIYGENLKVLQNMPSNQVHLVYLDPPFFSGSNYQVETKNGKHKQIVKFEDEWDCNKNEYIIRMYQRLKELHRILRLDGTTYLHCDHHASHWLKTIMDHIFGENNFRSEIIWQRFIRPFGSKSNNIFTSVSDSIFIYTKGNSYTYHQVDMPYPEEYINKFPEDDNDGYGKYCWNYFSVQKAKPSKKLLKENENHTILKQREDGIWMYKKYYNISKTYPLCNIWTDINRMKYIDYPTQKPEKLLERIILTSSNEGDTVLDPFVGGGTSITAAIKHGRNFIGIDQSPVATNFSANRVSKYNTNPIIRVESTMDDVNLMNPWLFQEWGIEKVRGITTNPNPGKPSGGDDGIDGYVSLPEILPLDRHFDEIGIKIWNKWHDAPISVEKRIVSENDVDRFRGAMKRHNKKVGIFIALGYTHTNDKIVKHDDMEILLLTAEDLCKVDRYNFEA